MKTFNEQQHIGRAKYVVNIHDGSRNADGSPFYGIRIFQNRRVKDAFVRTLARAGYVRESYGVTA